MVSLRIAQEKKPNNIAEKLNVPCCKDIIRCVVGCDAEKKVASIPLSNDTVHQRIVDMSDDLKQQVIAKLKEAPIGKFSIQLDKSTDVAACAQLMGFARYISGEDFMKNFLFCDNIDSATRGQDIFDKVSNLFEREGLSPGITHVGAQLMEHHQCLVVDQGFEDKWWRRILKQSIFIVCFIDMLWHGKLYHPC